MAKEGMKKRTISSIFISFIVSLTFVSASTSFTASLAGGSFGLAELISAIFGPFFGAFLGAPPHLLLENIMLFLIIFCLVYMTVKRIDILSSNKAVMLIITIAVSVLAGRFLTVELIYTALLPYKTLGIVLTAFLPLIIGFLFIYQFQTPVISKIFWIFFTVVFFTMWDANYAQAGQAGWIYLITAIISLIFFFLDGTIRRYLIRQKMHQANARTHEDLARQVRRQMRQAFDDLNQEIISPQEYEKLKKQYMKQLNSLAKY